MKLRISLSVVTDISARSLFYAFVMLAMDPALQDALVADIKQTIGDRTPTYEDYPNLVLPLCVQFETLRMFPPVATIPKLCPKETLLSGKYLIPKNVTLVFDTVHTHRNPKYWDDVDSFNPSRFDGRNITEKPARKEIDTGDTSPGGSYDKIKLPQKGAFCPFSEGSRSCLGMSMSFGVNL
jgi:cytochrome P450